MIVSRVMGIVAVVFLSLFMAAATSAKGPYLPYASFEVWRTLVPELSAPRLCGIANGGMQLWRDGQMRIPIEGSASILNIQLFSDDTEGLWAVSLADGDDMQPCQYILLAQRVGDRWQRIFLQQVTPENNWPNFDLIWNAQAAAFGIDFYQRIRLTKAATMTWENGYGSAEPGYVIEKRLISQVIRWNSAQGRFEYVQFAKPEIWDME